MLKIPPNFATEVSIFEEKPKQEANEKQALSTTTTKKLQAFAFKGSRQTNHTFKKKISYLKTFRSSLLQVKKSAKTLLVEQEKAPLASSQHPSATPQEVNGS